MLSWHLGKLSGRVFAVEKSRAFGMFFSGNMSGAFLGVCSVGISGRIVCDCGGVGVQAPMQDYTSLGLAFVILAIMVNTQIQRHTDTVTHAYTHTDSF